VVAVPCRRLPAEQYAGGEGDRPIALEASREPLALSIAVRDYPRWSG
jgi:hypothetical protein